MDFNSCHWIAWILINAMSAGRRIIRRIEEIEWAARSLLLGLNWWHSNVSEIPPWFVPSWKLWASPSQFAPAWQVLLAFSFSSCHRNSDLFPCTYLPISSDLFTPIWWPLDLTNHIPVLGVDSIDSSSKPECSDQICTFRKVMAEGDSANAWICQVTWEKAGRRLLKPNHFFTSLLVKLQRLHRPWLSLWGPCISKPPQFVTVSASVNRELKSLENRAECQSTCGFGHD